MHNRFLGALQTQKNNPVANIARGKHFETQGFVPQQPNNWLPDSSETTKQ
jgi:hypothetical protein